MEFRKSKRECNGRSTGLLPHKRPILLFKEKSDPTGHLENQFEILRYDGKEGSLRTDGLPSAHRLVDESPQELLAIQLPRVLTNEHRRAKEEGILSS